MTLTPTRTILDAAAAARTGVGAFNVLHLETAEALVGAAEDAGLPVILQLSENCVRYHGGFEPIARATLAVAEASSAAVAVHLDHAEDPELALLAIERGFGSVMYDGAKLDFAENVATTRRVVDRAARAGVLVEAELGEIGGKDGAHAPGVRTDPDEAARFVAETGVDALAVAVGSSHAMTERNAALDLELIARLHAAVPVPLVLHGSSGVPDDTIVRGIRSGLTKINVSTHLNGAFTGAIRDVPRAASVGRRLTKIPRGRARRGAARGRPPAAAVRIDTPGKRDRMNRAERLSAVLDLLAESGQVEVDQIVERLDVSPATARRDLDALASQQLLTRTRGGAVAHSVAYDLPIRYKNQQHPASKAAIARAASDLVPRGAVIGLCGGTTATAIVEQLLTRGDIMEPSADPGLTVVTNAINIAMQLAVRPQIKTVVTGGVVHARSYELVGSYTDAVLGSITLDYAFIGVNGIDPVIGPTSHDEREAAVNALMASRAAQRGARRRLVEDRQARVRRDRLGPPVLDAHHRQRRDAATSWRASPTGATTLSLPSELFHRRPLRTARQRVRHRSRLVGAIRG